MASETRDSFELSLRELEQFVFGIYSRRLFFIVIFCHPNQSERSATFVCVDCVTRRARKSRLAIHLITISGSVDQRVAI